MPTIRIPLSDGNFVVVDEADYPAVSQYRWYPHPRGRTIYARACIIHTRKRQMWIRMHNLILPPPDGYEVDHENGNGLDNRRENLRLVTHAQNSQNARLRADNTSGFRGVGWHQRKGLWQARISIDSKLRTLGYFADKDSAARAYDEAARQHYGEFARLNFPKEGELQA